MCVSYAKSYDSRADLKEGDRLFKFGHKELTASVALRCGLADYIVALLTRPCEIARTYIHR